MIEFDVYGIPAPQGSKRHVGNGRMIESSKKVKPWREAVKWAAFEAMAKGAGGLCPMDGPLSVLLVFTLPKPKSAPKGRTTWPQRKPDLDKLIRATFDALTDAGVWGDDAQVVALMSGKRFPNEGDDALSAPGCRVIIGWSN